PRVAQVDAERLPFRQGGTQRLSDRRHLVERDRTGQEDRLFLEGVGGHATIRVIAPAGLAAPSLTPNGGRGADTGLHGEHGYLRERSGRIARGTPDRSPDTSLP